MAQINNFITKNDLMFFQNEVFIDLKNLENLLSTKMTKLTENIESISKEYDQKFSAFSHKMNDLVELISVINIDHEKVQELYRNKDKIKDELTESKARFNAYKKQIDSSLYKYDRIIIDNLEVPGLIGYNCKFNNLKQFLDFANGELANLKLSKNQQIGELKIVKEKFDRFSQKLDISNKDMIQRIDVIYNNKFDSFKIDIEKQIEVIREIRAQENSHKSFDFSKVEEEIKRHLQKSQEDVKYEINDIFDKIKKNKEIIDTNHIIINKQKEDFNILREQFDKLCQDVENIKIQNISSNNKIINTKNYIMPINKNIRASDEKIKDNIKNKSNKIISTDLYNKYNINKDNNKDINNKDNEKNKKNIISKNNNIMKLNEDINYIINKEKERESLANNNIVNKKNDTKNSDLKPKSPPKNIKKRRASLGLDIKNKNEFLINDKDIELKDDNNFKRKVGKKLLTYCQQSNLKLGKNNITKNIDKNILDLSYNSLSSSSEKENQNQNNQLNGFKKGKMNNKFINDQINISISKNFDINKKIDKNVSKLIKLQPSEKPEKLDLIYPNDINNLNQPYSTRNINTINKGLQNKTKNVTFTINTFNKCKTENKNKIYINLTENSNNNEINSGKRNLNLTDKEILEKYINNIKNNKDKISSISKALHIKNYKNAFTSPNLIENKQKNKNNDNYGLNHSQKYSDENFFSNNESNNCITSPFITTKNYSLYGTTSNFYKKNDNERKPLSGFLTSIPIESNNRNEKEEDDEKIIIINNKIKKINYKLKKISSNTKIIINKLNLLEVNYKPINSQINDILMIILIIYEFIKKRSTNNKLFDNLFKNLNIKSHSKNQKFRGNNSLFSLNKAKKFLYTTNGFSLEEGGLYSNELTKEELNIILKKIEPFLIKQFKDTI